MVPRNSNSTGAFVARDTTASCCLRKYEKKKGHVQQYAKFTAVLVVGSLHHIHLQLQGVVVSPSTAAVPA